MEAPEFRISASFYIGAALCVLLLPLNWLLGWILAVTVHETGHILALTVCRVPIRQIHIGLSGARISVPDMTAGQELLSSAAGPLFSFLLVLLVRWVPLAALIGLVQGLFNMLPVYPLDGGRMLNAIITLLRQKNL